MSVVIIECCGVMVVVRGGMVYCHYHRAHLGVVT